MLNICNDCSGTIQKRYDSAHCEVKLRPAGADKMIAFHCSVSFDDILDVAAEGEWDEYLTEGKILLSPFAGNFLLGDGTTDTLTDGCGNKIPDITETGWTFTTPSVAEDYSDEDWWYAFHKEFRFYNWGWIDCSGRLALSDPAVIAVKTELAKETPGEAAVALPGFPFSLDIIPKFEQVNGPGKAGQWRAQGTFRHSHVIRTVEIPGLNALLSSKG